MREFFHMPEGKKFICGISWNLVLSYAPGYDPNSRGKKFICHILSAVVLLAVVDGAAAFEHRLGLGVDTRRRQRHRWRSRHARWRRWRQMEAPKSPWPFQFCFLWFFNWKSSKRIRVCCMADAAPEVQREIGRNLGVLGECPVRLNFLNYFCEPCKFKQIWKKLKIII